MSTKTLFIRTALVVAALPLLFASGISARQGRGGGFTQPDPIASAAPTESRDIATAETPPAPDEGGTPVVAPPPASRPDATARSPWATAADAGVAIGDAGAAIGRGSKSAGVATAGFFTRVAKRVGGSF